LPEREEDNAMRKGIHFLVLLAAALLLFSLPVRASDFEDDRLTFVTDEVGLLTDEEWTALETRAEELSTEYACGIYVITVDDFRNYTTDEDVYEAAKSLYQEYRLGYGEEQSGELLLLSMEERDYALIAYGYGNTAFTDYGKDKLSEKFLDDFGEDSWYKGFSDYLEKSGSMLRQAREGNPLDVGSNPLIRHAGILISIVTALVIALVITALAAKYSMQSVSRAHTAAAYLDAGSVTITGREDRFSHVTEARERIESDHSSGGTTIDSDGFSGKSGKF